MAKRPKKSQFIYFDGGFPNAPQNPAIAKILRNSRNRMWIRGIAMEAQGMFQLRARKGDPDRFKARNSQMVRTITHLVSGRDELGVTHALPDRWAARLEAYAPHALAREFGWDSAAKSRLQRRRGRPLKEKTIQKRAAERRQQLGEKNLQWIAQELERRHYHPYKGGQ